MCGMSLNLKGVMRKRWQTGRHSSGERGRKGQVENCRRFIPIKGRRRSMQGAGGVMVETLRLYTHRESQKATLRQRGT